ncbi:Abhydrolase-3 domain-containing protein [Mycena indigotica]|uniref:Abhydrolase-3 domain-containing protein n=1 Tax=Mycena indigotica TaxID=2126181 RepID=A0A8H6TF66_9AGAR|nr:Abhydrolase-3 domain-containing protein [Mycena indigotica]KAF7315582.1 Abhydrolase-3 domain-containing protein [Mycena indigotica]
MSGYAPYRHQPLKALYLTYELFTTTFIRLPYWLLASVVPSLRPRRSWGFRKAMQVRILRRFTGLSNAVGPIAKLPNHLALVTGVGYHGVWVPPVQEDAIQGQLSTWISVAQVSPTRLPGYWLHKPDSTINLEAALMPGEKIIYALHGGAYTRLSAHPSDLTAGIVRGFLNTVDSVHRTFSIEYRLSSTHPFAVEHPFPTALVDALAGYAYLCNKFPSSEIIVEGDSAGGNLALALTRYLVEYTNPKLPPPGGLLLLSPWCDMGRSHLTPDSSFRSCADSDYLPAKISGSLSYPVAAFTGPFGIGAAELNPYISPASKRLFSPPSFAGFPPTFISCGGAELLRDSIRTLHHRMAQDVRVEYLEAPDAVHDFIVFETHEPERSTSLAAIAKWIGTLP